MPAGRDRRPAGTPRPVRTRPGPAGATDGLETTTGIAFSVRTPPDYDPTVAWPLVVVYAGAGGDPQRMEVTTGLTDDATAAGFVIAYADHRSPTSEEVITALAGVPLAVADTWCIDPERTRMTGHSDGGSVTSVIAIWELLSPAPAAVAPSAAGVDAGWVGASACPPPLPVMVMHSADDTLFPVEEGFGGAVAAWWAACDACDPTPGPPSSDGCIQYSDCADDTEVLYCEGHGPHASWPDLNGPMLAFFSRH